MRFRKKPVVIEAIRYFEHNARDVLEWAGSNVQWHGGNIVIPTLEGVMHAMPGDWIICGVKGELYPCKPDIFDATYEPVADDIQRAADAAGGQ